MLGPRRVDPAVRQARLVVGLGDPDVTWSVLLRFLLSDPVDPGHLRVRLRDLHEEFAHFGSPGEVVEMSAPDDAVVLAEFADRRYGDRDPLLRVGLSRDGTGLLLASHHGAIDGLGMLGAASRLLGVEITSDARGRREGSGRGFAARAVRRLVGATWRPPARLVRGHPVIPGPGDHVRACGGPSLPVSSATLVLAAAALVPGWNAAHHLRRRPVTVALGVSRRPGRPSPPPDRDTGMMILRADDLHTVAEARARIVGTEPEPAFPARDGHALAPALVRLLQARVAATVGVSNLGRIAGDGVRRVDFWPVAAGPRGIALGLASTAGTTSLTVRAPRRWFGPDDADALTGQAWQALRLGASTAQLERADPRQ